MDILSMILAKNQGGKPLAYSEYTRLTLSYWGDTSGMDTIDGEGLGTDGIFVRVSGTVITGGTVENVFALTSGGFDVPVTNPHIESESEAGLWFLYGTVLGKERLLVLSVRSLDVGLPVGTYFAQWDNPAGGYWHVSQLSGNLTETIHPIDPKYIPGAVLPVVEITTELANGAILTETESKALTSASKYDTPVVINTVIEGFSVSEIATRAQVDEATAFMFQFYDKSYALAFVLGGDNWVVNVNVEG